MVDTNILLVDDDKDTCASMSDIFLDVGYTVDMAYDGPGALELSGRHQYRLALLDYNMPGMYGLELCRRCGTTTAWRTPSPSTSPASTPRRRPGAAPPSSP